MSRIVRLEDRTPLIINPKEHDKPLAVCRCGLAASWPMCDGSHKRTTDEGEGMYAYRRTTPDGDLVRQEVDAMPEADPRPQGTDADRDRMMAEAEREASR